MLNVFILSSMCRWRAAAAAAATVALWMCVCVSPRVYVCVYARTSHGFAFLLQLFVIISFFARRRLLQCISFSRCYFLLHVKEKTHTHIQFYLDFFMFMQCVSELVCVCVSVCVMALDLAPDSTTS